jgi:hypothetical protein
MKLQGGPNRKHRSYPWRCVVQYSFPSSGRICHNILALKMEEVDSSET